MRACWWTQIAGQVGDSLANALLSADQSNEAGIEDQRKRVAELKQKISSLDTPAARDLLGVADALVKQECVAGGRRWMGL